jgi:hypothetical protein
MGATRGSGEVVDEVELGWAKLPPRLEPPRGGRRGNRCRRSRVAAQALGSSLGGAEAGQSLACTSAVVAVPASRCTCWVVAVRCGGVSGGPVAAPSHGRGTVDPTVICKRGLPDPAMLAVRSAPTGSGDLASPRTQAVRPHICRYYDRPLE